MINSDFDFSWFENHLAKGYETDRIGGYVTDIGLQTYVPPSERPAGEEIKGDLIGQARQLYCLSRGYLITGEEHLREKAVKNAEVLLERFMDPADGGCFESAGVDGRVFDDTKTSYGNSHVAFGLGFAARATGEVRHRDAAWRSWRFLQGPMTDEYGGMYYATSRDGTPVEGRKAQNPIMHQFEGMIALGDCDGCSEAYRDARGIADFMIGKLLREHDSVLPEYYRNDWSVLPGGEGGSIYVGHLFEWAFFLLMGVDRGFPNEYISTAERMVEAGLRIGFDEADGGVYSTVLPEGGLAARSKTFWEQCEAIRVMLRLALLHRRDDLWPYIRRITEYTKNVFVESDGAWYFEVAENGNRRPTGGMHRLDYHTVGLCAEIMRLSQYA